LYALTFDKGMAAILRVGQSKALENLTWWGRIKCDPLATVIFALCKNNILEPRAKYTEHRIHV
jgi:hypothetical protein